MKLKYCAAATAAVFCRLAISQGALAQEQPAAAPTPPPAATAPPATPAATPVASTPDASARALAGTVIELEITQTVSSKTSKRGDTFSLRLVEPIVAGSQVLVPAGTTGVGEVVDSGRPGMAGSPGKLVLAGRYLDYQGQHIKIRSFKVGGAGKDNTKLATGVAVAVGLPAMFITGGDIEIPSGTVVSAKLAADYPPAAEPAPAPAATTPAASAPTAAKPAEKGTSK